MAAPVSFRERSDSFPSHCGRRPYMALGCRTGMSAFTESLEGKRMQIPRVGRYVSFSRYGGQSREHVAARSHVKDRPILATERRNGNRQRRPRGARPFGLK